MTEVLEVLDDDVSTAEDNLLVDISERIGEMAAMNKKLQMTVHILKTVVGEGRSN